MSRRHQRHLAHHHLHHREQEYRQAAAAGGRVRDCAVCHGQVCRLHGGCAVHLSRVRFRTDFLALARRRHAAEGAHHLATRHLPSLFNKHANVSFPSPTARRSRRSPASRGDCTRCGSLCIAAPPRSSQETGGWDRSAATNASAGKENAPPGWIKGRRTHRTRGSTGSGGCPDKCGHLRTLVVTLPSIAHHLDGKSL